MTFNHPLRFGMVAGIHEPWDEIIRRAKLAEELNFDIVWVTDHLFGGPDEMTHTFEGYSVLAGIAMATERVRLGIMVAANTYRNPALLLKQAVTVDHISNGRLDFGIGSGFWEREHEAYSYDFPTPGQLVEQFDEALEVIHSLQRNERTNFEGEYYKYVNTPFVPKPIQQPEMPIVIGASGPRMLGVTAKHADIWNTRRSLEESAAKSEYLTECCERIGRDPAEIKRSIWPFGQFFGSTADFTEFVESFQGVGFSDFLFSWPDSEAGEEVLKLVATDVIPAMKR